MLRQAITLLLLFISLVSFSQAPTAQFSGSPTSVCIGDLVTFTNQSIPGGSPIVSQGWDFGDGNSATTLNATHAYTAAGVYTVTLVVTAQNGQADPEVKVNYITVNPTPTASFSISGNGCAVPFNVTFTNTSTGGNTYAWDFGNGQTSTQQNPPSITYSTVGTFTASLTVTNSATGCSATITHNIVVSTFSAGITAPANACQGTSIAIQDNSTVGANTWSWDFGNGQTSTQQNPSVSYSAPGTYTISLTSQNTVSGCSNTTTTSITIFPLPAPSFTMTPLSGCSPLNVTFTNNSASGATTYQWNFGDGTTFTGQNPPVHSYASDGAYEVSLTITNSNGCVGTIQSTDTIKVSPPIVGFMALDTNGCSPLSVQFTDTSSSSNPAQDPIVSWSWNFGNGNTSTLQNPPAQTYGTGIWDVSLTITTQHGCTGTITKPGYIQVGYINSIDFTINPTVSCVKNDIAFTSNVVITALHDSSEVTYSWDFGDGGTSTQENPHYQYASDTGYFDITLIVDFRGCKDTLKKPQAVYIKAPLSRFTPAQTLYCNPSSLPVNVQLNDNSIIGASGDNCLMIWRFGGGVDTTIQNSDLHDADEGSTAHNYGSYGTYSIRQVIYNYTTGCADSTDQVINISKTTASFNIPNDSICKDSPLSMSSTSTSSHPFGTFDYNMGDGSPVIGVAADTSYAYTTAGTYTITLTATNQVGCAGTATKGITVLELPNAQLTGSVSTGCAPLHVTFSNQSTKVGNGVPLSSFNWTFTDGSTTTTNNVGSTTDFTFTTQGNFVTTLVATDQFGCVSAPATTTTIITKPTADFFMDSVVCKMESFTTVNGTTGANPITYQWDIDNVNSSTSNNLTHAFNDPDNPTNFKQHAITLIATDVNGCVDSLTKNIVVSLPHPDIQYVFDGASTNANGDFTCPPVFATLTNGSADYGTISTYHWVFGDGKQSSLENPNNTYVFAGTYSVELTITDEFGCVGDTTLVDYLTIFGPSATPSWSATAGDLCGQSYDFLINNLNNVDNISWNLGDGTSVNDSTAFTHSYESVDTFEPTVTIKDSLGCAVVYPLDTIVVPSSGLNAYFTANPNQGDMGTIFTFTDGSTANDPITQWTWSLVDSSVVNSSGVSVSQLVYAPGGHIIKLQIVDQNGCKDSYQLTIKVSSEFTMPNVFTPNGDGQNDLFKLFADIFKSFNIVITNRWGNPITDRQNQTGTLLWDGKTQNGQECDEGVYFYLLTGVLKDNVTNVKKQGFVTKAK